MFKSYGGIAKEGKPWRGRLAWVPRHSKVKEVVRNGTTMGWW